MNHSFLAILAVLAATCSCAETKYTWYSEHPMQPPATTRGTIEKGDKIFVEVEGHPDLSGEFEISASGSYAQPVAGSVTVAGADLVTAAKRVRDALSKYVEVTNVTISLKALPPIAVNVVGEVERSGTYEVPHDANLLAVLAAAGGLSDFADGDAIFLVRATPEPQRIRFRYRDLTRPEPAAIGFRLRDGDTLLVE